MPAKPLYMIKEYIKSNGYIEIPAEGTSMYPIIKEDDVCKFELIHDVTSVKKGDIILFETTNQKLVAHRFMKTVNQNQSLQFICKGDTNLSCDDPVTKQQIIGRLTAITRGDTVIFTNSLLFFLWMRLIVTIPILSTFLRAYHNKRISTKPKINSY